MKYMTASLYSSSRKYKHLIIYRRVVWAIWHSPLVTDNDIEKMKYNDKNIIDYINTQFGVIIQ